MKKIIFFQAHPDDLEFFCAHLLHYLAQKDNIYEIKIASLTKGEFSTPPHKYAHFKGERLGKIRARELIQAEKIHGIKPEHIHFFGILDQMVKFDKDTVELVRNYLYKEKPSIIFAPEPINTYYRHQDHIAIGKILYYIYDKKIIDENPKLYYFAPLNPNFYWPFAKTDISFAFKMIDIHKSQNWMMKYLKPLYIIIGKFYGRNIKGWKYAEGYRRVFYREEKHKNKKLTFLMNCLNFLALKLFPKDLSKYVPIPDHLKDNKD